MSKKIAIIIERSNIVLGGAERSVFETSLALTALGHRVDILAAKGQTNAKNIHILCQDHRGKRTSHSVFAKALKGYLSRNSYDIVHSVLPFDFADIYQPRGGSFAESIIRNAVSFENSFLESYKRIMAFTNIRRAAMLRAERRLCTNPNGPVVAALSNYVADQFRRHYGLPDERIRIISNGVKTHKKVNTADADRLRSQILAKLRLLEADNPVFFLFVANNFRLKGLGPLLRALHIATKNNKAHPAYLVVAGHGKARKYRYLARKYRVRNRVIFLGNVRHIQDAMAITDVGVLPTFYDPASRFILEALAEKKPVITTSFNGAADLFEPNRHGKLIDLPTNVEALADAIEYYINPDNIKKASQAIADDKIEEKISIKRVASQLDRLYNEIIEKRRH